MAEQRTRADLIDAGLNLFALGGFGATSTRAIAARAGTNVASIAYHFGGKEGLRLACADAVAGAIGRVARAMPADPRCLPPARARALLLRLLRRMVGFLIATPGAAGLVGFLLRELAEPHSPVLDRLYQTLIEPRHQTLCDLWAAATGADPDSEETRIAVFAAVGQIFYFRIAAPIVQRRMGWQGYSRAEAHAISRRLLANLDAIFEAADA